MISLFGPNETSPATSAKSGLMERMKQAVARTRDGLQDRVAGLLARTRPVDSATLAQLESALITADIGARTASEVVEKVRQQAARQQVRDGAGLKALLQTEMQRVLDSVQARPDTFASVPAVVFLVGVNGTGKTTTAGKLAAFYRAQGKSVLLCAADTFRAAAIEQLEVWGRRAGTEIVRTRQGGDPSAALFDALQSAKARSVDVVLVDTAGRLHTKGNLMAELEKMRRTAQRLVDGAPHLTLLVMDATTGQNGLNQARLFTESVAVNGIVLTKLDGTAKGGIVLAIARELGLPVRFAGTGEQMEDLVPFDSATFVASLLDN